jgi:hypothetical protein
VSTTARLIEQLAERERLGEVVVGAAVQPVHAVVDRVTRREDQDRRFDVLGADRAAHLKAVDVGKGDLGDDRRVVGCGRPLDRLPAAGDVVGEDRTGGHALDEDRPEALVVVGDEDSHGHTITDRSR